MSVLDIHISGSPLLHTPALPVTTVDDALHTLLADMEETMHAAPGVGLAAPQVGVSLQVFLWDYTDDDGRHHGHVINPSLSLRGWPRYALVGRPEEEGCLSLPGLRAPLARRPRAILTGHTITGARIRVDATGWLARIFQHEFDHLQGILYRDRLRRRARSEIDLEVHQNGWGVPGCLWTPGPDNRESNFV